MNIQALSNEHGTTFVLPAREKHRPFLEALKQVEYGQLLLITPEGKQVVFKGAQEGAQADWRVHDWRVFDDFIACGELGLVDAYIDGRWDSQNLEALTTFGLMNAGQLERFFHGRPLYALWLRLCNMFSSNTIARSKKNAMAHYDLGNDFYTLWLDKSMTYSCALFEGHAERTLEDAQQAKYARILQKLNASTGQHILEIGCGWGGFAEAAAKKGLRVTAITLANKQAEYTQKRIQALGLDSMVSVELMDYRAVQGQFDHIVSIGMFEHVGESYWPVYFDTIHHRLKPHGTAIIQTITLNDSIFEKLHTVTGFIESYIFPGGMLPSKTRFRLHAQNAKLECREMYAFGRDYAITLRRWLDRFDSRLDKVKALGYDERFIRLWRFYLASCISSFKTGRTDVMQVELKRASL